MCSPNLQRETFCRTNEFKIFHKKFEKIFLKTRFKHNLGLHKLRMRFKLFYTFIFLYWSVLLAGPFVN